MAGEAKKPAAPAEKRSSDDIIIAILFLLFLSTLVQRIPLFLQGKLGIDTGSPFLVLEAGVYEDTPIGSRVSVLADTPYYEIPACNSALGTFPPGTALVLLSAQNNVLTNRWREVQRVGTAEQGWVSENLLIREDVAGGVTPDTLQGTPVRAITNTALWVAPGGGEAVASFKKGTRAILTEGPQRVSGTPWWFVHGNDSGVETSGWVPQTALLRTSINDWHADTTLRALHATDLFDHIGGGVSVAVVAEGETVRVVDGPERAGEEYWWLLENSAKKQGWSAEQSFIGGGAQGKIHSVLTVWTVVGTVLVLLLLGGIAFAVFHTRQLRFAETQRILPHVNMPASDLGKKTTESARWNTVQAHLQSSNPNDWRLAILEADVMLDELVTTMGYAGNTLGERLKQAARGDFKTLDNAWEAHRVRNMIAHTGSGFVLSSHEAKRVLDLYASVFNEFHFI